MRFALALASSLLCVAVSEPQTGTSQKVPVFGAQIESVFIDVFTSGDKAALTGLSARDFVLMDDGAEVPFDLVPTASLPVRAILVFDTSSSMKGAKLTRLRSAAWSFLDQLRPQDEAGLISFSDEIAWLAPLSGDLAQARLGLLSLEASGSTSVYDALFAALLLPRSALRTLVILFSDGEDNMSWLQASGLRRMVERSNALIHVVAAKSETFRSGFSFGSRPPESDYIKTLRSLSEITGGSLIEVDRPEGIESAFAAILEAMKNRYVLRYAPDTEPAAGWHKLDTRLRTKKGKVRGRAGYWVGR